MEMSTKARKESEERVAEEYLSSLSDLNCNSKPLINMLTMLAEENIEFAPIIVKVVEQHISKVLPDYKLPILYLIDSIVKNVKSTYVQLFSQCIVNIFCGVFEKVNEKVRERMYALRHTWNEVFSPQKLYALDVKVKRIDNNWPITATQPPQPSIHVNPNFLKTVAPDMGEILHAKTRELLELKKLKLELELEATKKHLEEQEKQLTRTAESVVAPAVDPLLQPGIVPPPQMVAGMMAPGIMPPHHMPATAGAIMRPDMYHHNFRNPRPQVPGMVGGPAQQAAILNKPKVHPVNSALLNTVRHRDPRLARQQQQQSTQPMPSGRGLPTARSTSNSTEDTSKKDERNSDYRSSKSGRSMSSGGGSGGSGSESKSPTRHASSSSSRFSGRSGKSSSGRSEKEKERKRSESKSSTTSSSSGGSSASIERRKNSASAAASRDKSAASKCDKDAFEIAPLSTAFKRKPSSPGSSPLKPKESKRSSKSRTYAGSSKQRSRSRSPEVSETPPQDVDLRTMIPAPAAVSPERRPKSQSIDIVEEETKSPDTFKDLDKNIKIMLAPLPITSSIMDTDLRQLHTSSTPAAVSVLVKPATISDIRTATACAKKVATTTINTTTTTSSPKVSFKIHKLFNKLEKSTEHSSPASATATSKPADLSEPKATSSSVGMELDDNEVHRVEKKLSSKADTPALSIGGKEEDELKRRSLPATVEEQPTAKKSKSAKFDALFGSEDVDLRTVMPPQIMAVQKQAASSSGTMTPPPPPVISEDESALPSNVENWDNLKPSKRISHISKISPKKLSSLDDVRAKLAKAAKYNKFKNEKSHKELTQRFKLAELNMNDDSQEANDEKIRTIITQAQELLESNSINQDQYKNLVQTVMAINETNKLKEAKRRESLNVAKSRLTMEDEDSISSIDAERMAARDAVLKKRIPKLPKGQTLASDNSTAEAAHLSDGGTIGDEERSNGSEEAPPPPKMKPSKEKRTKTSKWSERNDNANATAALGHAAMSAQRPWMPGPNNKRNGPPFRPNVPPHMSNANARPPQLAWQIGAPGLQAPPFGNIMPMRFSTVPMPPQPPSLNMPMPLPAPPVIPKPCNSIDNPQADLVRSITIDGRAKEIRIYDQIAIVFMEADQPREIGFQAGQRSIIIDNEEPISLTFNDDYKPCSINGEPHRLRFGFPSRELYVDEHWYEIYFGGPPVSIPINNRIHVLKAEGPPPQVNIGALRLDLVVGKINMIVDALIVIPLFLDARIQSFRLNEKDHTIQFADNLLTVLLDGEPTMVEYGGLPKSLTLGGIKYFIRFGALPQGVVAGKARIKDMLYVKTEPTIEPVEIEVIPDSPNMVAATSSAQTVTNDAATTSKDEAKPVTESATSSTIPILPAAALSSINIDELFQKLVSSGILGGGAPAGATGGPVATSNASAESTTAAATDSVTPAAAAEDAEPMIAIKPINLSKSETIKARQAAIVSTLFSGMQCSSCGVRFPPEQTIKYSQHLDWHFRQNRRERDSTRKAHSRKWFFDVADWVQYEEIEDLEEREKNFFESQQNDPETMDETSNQRSTNSPMPSCAALPEDVDRACDMCHEKFEQFYNEELEEWHLRSAVRVEDKLYHPLCYEDYKTSLNPPKVEDEPMAVDENKLVLDDDGNAMDAIIKIEGDEKSDEEKASVTIDDDDDDVIVLPNEEPSVTEIDDDEEYIPLNVTREDMCVIAASDNAQNGDAATESDVEIQEPHIPFTDLDTYEEKELPGLDETSQASFMNVKIKEEPKDDEDDDEDDGFEDVGTVLIAPDEEISIQSSEETQTQTVGSSTSAASPSAERPSSVASLVQLDNTESSEALPDQVIAMDGNMETTSEHNLSVAGPAPAIPLASLVNRIKINITKNIVSTNNNSTSASSASSATTNATSASSSANNTAGSLNSSSNESHRGGNSADTPNVSTIPVLCGGGTTSNAATSKDGGSAAASVSSISVIGSSYGGASRYYPDTTTHALKPAASSVAASAPRQATPPPPIEDTITFEVKPSLQKAPLKKMKKVECGVETSGLCSLM